MKEDTTNAAQPPLKVGDTFDLHAVYWKSYMDKPAIYATKAIALEFSGTDFGNCKFDCKNPINSEMEWWYMSRVDRMNSNYGCECVIGFTLSQEGAESMRLEWVMRSAEETAKGIDRSTARAKLWADMLAGMTGEGRVAGQPPLTLSALTEEHAIQIAKMACGNFNLRHAHEFTAMLSGTRISVLVKRERLSELVVHIHSNFTVHLSRERDGKLLPCNTSNDRAIQKLFTEWGAE